MPRNHRIAPKSIMQSRTKSAAASLGDSTTSESSMETENNENQSEFHTPDMDNNDTDYGLEFTTSRSPRRCSTLKTLPREQQQSDHNSELSQNTISENSKVEANKSKQKEVTESVKQKVQKNPLQASNEKDAPIVREVVRQRRKQRNPKQREMRFLKEVQNLQNRTDNIIPKLPFSRLVREIIQSCTTEVTMITRAALEGLQLSSELYMTQFLQDAYYFTLHRGRITLAVQDIELRKFLHLHYF